MINIIQNTIGALGRSGGGGDTTSFITTWRTTTASETITIPTTGTGYNYAISTSDGQSFSGVTGSQAITFASAGDYDVSISGDFPRIYFSNGGDKLKMIDIKQWGDIAWTSFDRSFYGCLNLVNSFTDSPILIGVISLNNMFRGVSVFVGDISIWDISGINSMSTMFHESIIPTISYDATLIGWEATLQSAFPSGTGYTPTISISFGSSEYTGGGAAATARASLISNFGWTITDGGIA